MWSCHSSFKHLGHQCWQPAVTLLELSALSGGASEPDWGLGARGSDQAPERLPASTPPTYISILGSRGCWPEPGVQAWAVPPTQTGLRASPMALLPPLWGPPHLHVAAPVPLLYQTPTSPEAQQHAGPWPPPPTAPKEGGQLASGLKLGKAGPLQEPERCLHYSYSQAFSGPWLRLPSARLRSVSTGELHLGPDSELQASTRTGSVPGDGRLLTLTGTSWHGPLLPAHLLPAEGLEVGELGPAFLLWS